jgi:CxxC motif-containing protein (DUF1111 family)
MKRLKFVLIVLVVLVYGLVISSGVSSHTNSSPKQTGTSMAPMANASEAPTGFDNLTNGFVIQRDFNRALEVFDEREEIDEGLGPVYNAQACAECHQNPVSGGISQITEMRAGKFDGTNFYDHPGGSLLHSRAVDSSIQEYMIDGNNVHSARTSLNILGDGFVEAVADETFIQLAKNQSAQTGGRIAGQVVFVPIVESPGAVGVGRFGWKDQHASLLSFAGDAYVNEMGVTNPLFPIDNTSNGDPVDDFDPIPGIESFDDTDQFAIFMRATKAPPRGAITQAVINGEQTFNAIGCAICHVPTLTTAPAGTSINGGRFTIPSALGDKTFHPFSDFLLHDVGTGDGIVQNGGQTTRNKLRTPPLWGVRTRNRLMHDGESLSFAAAILRHKGEATTVVRNYSLLKASEKQNLIAFLRSL